MCWIFKTVRFYFKYIQDEKVFHNFLCKYSEISLPEDFEQVGLIIDKYKKLNKDSALSDDKVNERILVKNGTFSKEFDSIMDAVRYFENINIKLDRKFLNSRLKDGKSYKGYYFSYKIVK